MTAAHAEVYKHGVTAKDAPPGERVAFQIEEDASMRLLVDDGTVLIVKPIVLDVLRGTVDKQPVYYVQSLVSVVVKPPTKDAV